MTDFLQEPLQVKMFGTFTVQYGGVVLVGEKTAKTQFAYLMQMLLHYRKEGVTREALERAVFGGREVEDIHHALQCVVYNAKKRLEKTGLPKCNYISYRKGLFRWTTEIPVQEDATEFEQLLQMAQREELEDRKISLLFDAVHCYTGEFATTGDVWAATEAHRYRQEFSRCVEELRDLLKEQKAYHKLYSLGQYAKEVQPFMNWEIVEMEALIGLRRFSEARTIYERTVDSYLRERGMRPSQELLDLFETLGGKIEHPHALLDEIYKETKAGFSSARGGYGVSYPVFQGLCQMVCRMAERTGQTAYLMLCTIVDNMGNPMQDEAQLDYCGQKLETAIQQSVRRGDALTRYGKGQYLVLLLNTSLENCGVVQRRISRNFLEGRQKFGVEFHARSLMEPEESSRNRPQFGENLWQTQA